MQLILKYLTPALLITNLLSPVAAIAKPIDYDKLCPQPKSTESSSLQSRTFRSSDGITFELPVNYHVANIKNTLTVLDDAAYKYMQCGFRNKITSGYYVDSIEISIAHDRETLLYVLKNYHTETIKFGERKFLIYKSEGEYSQINAMTYDESKHRLVTVSAYLDNGNNIVMEPAFYQILSTLSF